MVAQPQYRVVLVLPSGRRKPLNAVYADFYRAADKARFHEQRGQRCGRPVLAEIVTVPQPAPAAPQVNE